MNPTATPKVHTMAELASLVAKCASGNALTEPDSTHSVTHPAVPTDPESAKAKQQLPADLQNAPAPTQIATEATKPGPVGTNVPESKTAPSIDPNPNFANAKVATLATQVADVAGRAMALIKGASATAPAAAAPAATAAPAAEPASPAPAKSAADIDAGVNIDTDMYVKLARAILEVPGGVEMAEQVLAAGRGIADAQTLIKDATAAHQNFLAQLEQEEELTKLASSVEFQQLQHLKTAFEKATPAEQKVIVKVASALQAGSQRYEHPTLKMAFAAGASDGAAMMESVPPGAEGEPMGGEGEPALPGAGPADAPAGPEEIAQALQMLVESKEISPEVAEQVLQQILGGAAGAPEAGGSPAEAGGEAPVPEEAEGAEAEKQANALIASLFPAPKAQAA